ncbi:MAG: hypothetical protein M3328_09400 [Chloroflexota bacterium]|nr:hypothetical protein [Chloroflexota bacterium]
MDTRRTFGIVLTEIAGLGSIAMLFYYLHVSGAATMSDPWSVDRVVAYLLMFVGALLIFLPFSMALRLGPVWLLGAGSWSLLGYVLVFVPAPQGSSASFFTYVAFLALLFVALSSALALPLAAVGKRLLPSANATREMVRSLRQGALLALFLVSLLAMSPLGVLNWLNIVLIFTTVSLTEFFFLARN